MARARVLVVDDSVVVRRLVTDALGTDPTIEVVGTAPNGRIALAKIPQVNPDLVTLDIEMPELDGLSTLPLLRAKYPKLPVIMFSTLTQRGAAATLDALRLGATDWVTKPANVGSVVVAQQRIRDELIPKIHNLTGHVSLPHQATMDLHIPPTAPKLTPSVGLKKIDVVCIGVSTGGPNALAAVIPQLPRDLGVPVVIVQHMPALFTQLLARRLSVGTGMQVDEGRAGGAVLPGRAWLAPGDWHMIVERKDDRVSIGLNQAPPENSCRPAVDVLFASVAKVYGGRALGVVLTGMGQDGLRGGEKIVDAGGSLIIQDEATSVVWGMPGAVARAGLAEEILPLDRIAQNIIKRARFGREFQAAVRNVSR
ncbi:chemotaxis response regulator protein-glutamate methylesterase [Myxococcota bacterium]|nr:chemotaxis response regulator protein-glutamate methylesterase [Myxococcota bacterium]